MLREGSSSLRRVQSKESFIDIPNPPCELSVREETEQPGENPRSSREI